jgi:SAM-dependent methyltransferase
MTDLAQHYSSGTPAENVAAALEQTYPGADKLTLDQLMGFDHFHTGGIAATVRLADLLAPSADEVVLDAGCGLGGPARYLADRTGCRVIGVDLTPEFIEIGKMLNERTGLGGRVDLRVGDITALDLADGEVDHVWTQHVAMNIADREGLYAETRRVMKPGGRFVLFDVIDGEGGELLIPVPWATKPEHSHLVARDALHGLLEKAGFRIEAWEDPTEEQVAILRQMMGPPPPGAQPPPLTPRLYIDNTEAKMPNYFANIEQGRTSLVLAMCVAV